MKRLSDSNHMEDGMHNYSIDDQTRIEKAIILASSKFAMCHDLIKPTLLHAVRVGSWLYFQGYETNIVIAGFLHDIIEDTDVTENEVFEDFGLEVASIVKANTKNTIIQEKKIRNQELVKRCLETSEKASIVKAADILDNYKYYLNLNNQAGIEYCIDNALSFKNFFNDTYKDKIFIKLFEEFKQANLTMLN
jgi:(p)ppGpp synthase/HD superfamily hydrolase